MIVADFENLEMHLLRLIAELLLHGSKWHVRPFCLPHFGSFDVMRSSDNMLYRRSWSQGCRGEIKSTNQYSSITSI